MAFTITRRAALAGALLLPALGARAASARSAEDGLAELERRHGGRLGVAVLDLQTGKRAGRRADERFPMCSTFKLLAAAFVLARVERGEESLDRRVVFAESDLIPWSPVTEKHVGEPGMTMAELCEAAVTWSDNTAANAMLESFGGPEGLTAWLRSLGDEVTRLDRYEPELNESAPGDPRDTTTPAAMLETMRKLVLGDALGDAARRQLAAWLVANRTGDNRLRAGFPDGWRVGDKTGTNMNGLAADVAVAWPPDRAPLLVACYFDVADATGDQREAVIAEVGRIAAGL